MKTLHINIADKVATYQTTDGVLICGNADYQIEFTFDEEWNAHADKVARFIAGGEFIDIPFTGNTCTVPMLSKVGEIAVGVYVEGELATTTAKIPCALSVRCNGGLKFAPALQDLTITADGTYKAEEGFYGLGEVTVDVVKTVPFKFHMSGGTAATPKITTYLYGEIKTVTVADDGYVYTEYYNEYNDLVRDRVDCELVVNSVIYVPVSAPYNDEMYKGLSLEHSIYEEMFTTYHKIFVVTGEEAVEIYC